jgi:hypothetical protein
MTAGSAIIQVRRKDASSHTLGDKAANRSCRPFAHRIGQIAIGAPFVRHDAEDMQVRSFPSRFQKQMLGQLRFAAPTAIEEQPRHRSVGGLHIRPGFLVAELVEEIIEDPDRGLARGTLATPFLVADQVSDKHHIVLRTQFDDEQADRLLLALRKQAEQKLRALPLISGEEPGLLGDAPASLRRIQHLGGGLVFDPGFHRSTGIAPQHRTQDEILGFNDKGRRRQAGHDGIFLREEARIRGRLPNCVQ